MLDHVSFGVADMAKSAAFYDAVLAPIGYARRMETAEGIAWGRQYPSFWIGPAGERGGGRRPGFHLAFRAPDRAAVDAFHAAALKHGGGDDGPPGLRPHYAANYYAAFVIDPDGHKIEAVTFLPEDT